MPWGSDIRSSQQNCTTLPGSVVQNQWHECHLAGAFREVYSVSSGPRVSTSSLTRPVGYWLYTFGTSSRACRLAYDVASTMSLVAQHLCPLQLSSPPSWMLSCEAQVFWLIFWALLPCTSTQVSSRSCHSVWELLDGTFQDVPIWFKRQQLATCIFLNSKCGQWDTGANF